VTSGPVHLPVDPQLHLEVRSTALTSDAGLSLPLESDERLGLNTLTGRPSTDPRTGHDRQFPLRDLFRQRIDSSLAGDEDTNDAERLAEDPGACPSSWTSVLADPAGGWCGAATGDRRRVRHGA
jgi:hypothetical protein